MITTIAKFEKIAPTALLQDRTYLLFQEIKGQAVYFGTYRAKRIKGHRRPVLVAWEKGEEVWYDYEACGLTAVLLPDQFSPEQEGQS